MCTLPFGRRLPASSHSSDIGAKLAEALSATPSEHPPADILYLLDESLERHIRDLAHRSAPRPEAAVAKDDPPAQQPSPTGAAGGPAGAANPPKPAGNVGSAAKPAPPPEDAFEIGDRVRLRPGKNGSSVAVLKPAKTPGAFYCGRNVGKAVLPSGTCTEAGPHCPSCRAFAALGVKDTKVASECCLGAAKDGRVGIVKAVRAAPAGARIVRVVSAHSGHVCYYAADDLMYADGSLPGPCLVMPLADPGKPVGAKPGAAAAAGNPSLPADWGSVYVASVEVSSDANGSGPQVGTCAPPPRGKKTRRAAAARRLVGGESAPSTARWLMRDGRGGGGGRRRQGPLAPPSPRSRAWLSWSVDGWRRGC